MCSSEVMSILSPHTEDPFPEPQPHDDALVVTLQIGGYNVRRILVDQGSDIEIMYRNLYKGLKLKFKDLVSYESPLVGFDGKTVVPRDMIRLPIQVGSRVVEVNFIMVDAYSPYIAIFARLWLYAMEAISSTLHLKVKYPFGDHVEKLIGSQAVARQCLVATISYQTPVQGRDGNFAPPNLTRPSQLRPMQIFPAPQRWWGGDGAKFLPHTTRQDGDEFRLFRPNPPCSAPSLPGLALIRVKL